MILQKAEVTDKGPFLEYVKYVLLTIVEPVGVGHGPANNLQVKSGSLSLRAFY